MADNRKLAQGLMMMTPAMREDLAGREQDIQRGKTVELLRRAGKEMYENPIVNTAVGLSPVLGDIQAGVEAYRSAEAGDWGNAGLNAAGMLPFIPMLGKTVWHGSPHTFDKFDMSKIGTGEGAQAYGHGLYLAEARPTAEEYANVLGKEVSFNKNPLIKSNELVGSTGNADLDNRLLKNYGDVNATRSDLEHDLRYFSKNKPEVAERVQNMIKQLDESNVAVESAGQLYKVDLPDEQISKMLDWDKPLSEQPEILGKLRSYAEQNPNMNSMFRESLSPMEAGSTTGDAIYRTLNRSLDESKALMQQRDALISKYQTGKMSMSDSVRAMNPEDRAAFSDVAQRIDDQKNVAARTSNLLNELGIPGIQYLDQASRGAGDGTRNYVVFSDEIPQILERNGTPLGNAVRNFEPTQTLESLNPTGTVFTGYDPTQRANMPLGKNLGTLDQTMGVNPDEMVTIYRGVPSDVSQISPGDFITTNEQLAKDYAGSGKVISQKVPARTVLDDLTEPLGEEYIYRP